MNTRRTLISAHEDADFQALVAHQLRVNWISTALQFVGCIMGLVFCIMVPLSMLPGADNVTYLYGGIAVATASLALFGIAHLVEDLFEWYRRRAFAKAEVERLLERMMWASDQVRETTREY